MYQKETILPRKKGVVWCCYGSTRGQGEQMFCFPFRISYSCREMRTSSSVSWLMRNRLCDCRIYSIDVWFRGSELITPQESANTAQQGPWCDNNLSPWETMRAMVGAWMEVGHLKCCMNSSSSKRQHSIVWQQSSQENTCCCKNIFKFKTNQIPLA